jgi:hypothetical protein
LGTGHASWKASLEPEPLEASPVQLEDWLTSAENFARHIALREFVPSDGDTLAATETGWDLVHVAPTDSTTINTVSLMEKEYRLHATMQHVDHLEASNIPVIASNVQLEVIRLSDELNKVKGLTPTFKQRFRLQERYVNLLLSSTKKHTVFGIRAQEYLRHDIIPNVDEANPEMRDIWLSIGRMYYAMKAPGPAREWLRLALFNGYVRCSRDENHSQIEEISKLVCRIYEAEGHPEYATALRQVLEHQIGYDPTKVAVDLEKALEWCIKKGFDVRAEGDQLLFAHQQNAKGNTVLHEAALDTRVEVKTVSKLMINDLLALSNASGDTALLLAIGKTNTAVITSLLKTPSLLHARDREGRTPLHRCHDQKTLSLVLEAMNGSRHRSSLTHVDRNSHDASSLIDINSKDACGRTALFTACRHGNLKMIKKLLEASADVHIPDKTGVCPILACSASPNITRLIKRKEMILLLLTRNANPDEEDFDGNTARKELGRHFPSSKKVNQFLAQDPAVALEEIKRLSRDQKRWSSSVLSTTRSILSSLWCFNSETHSLN